MKRYFTLLVSLPVLALPFAAGCYDSTVPLSIPSESKSDNRLIGLWLQDHEHGKTYYFVGRLGGRSPNSMMRMVTVALDTNDELEDPQQWLVFPTSLDDNSYLNLAPVSQEEIERVQKEGWRVNIVDSYILAKYRVEDDTVVAWPTDNDVKKKAIQSGKIQGETRASDGGQQVVFTDTTENLARFVAGDEELFSTQPIRLKRVR